MALVPSSYPTRAVVYVFTHIDILKLVLRYFLTELIPVYWVFRSLTEAHHRRLFLDVLTLRGVDPITVAKLSQADQLELKVQTQNQQAKMQVQSSRAQEQHPAVKLGLWLFSPPTKQDGRAQYIVHRILTIPIRSVLPFLPVLFGAINSGTITREALIPYFELKGIESPAQQAAIAANHKWSYRQFGGAALILQCIPVLTLFLQFVTTVAAAMWAADIEKTGFSLVKKENLPRDVKE